MSRTIFPRVYLIVLTLALTGSSLAQEPLNLSTAKRDVMAYVESGAYGKELVKIAMEANKHIIRRAARGAKEGQKLAVIFDIDETTLTNLPHMQTLDFGYVPPLWDEWVAAGQARAIIPVQTVYDTALRLCLEIIFITGRKVSDAPGTEKNLREVGYDTWGQIHYKPNDYTGTSQDFKIGVRKRLAREGYVIIANVGDQWSDLNGGYAEKVFKLPNPFYWIP
jgi:predicted secreted acid phosphatase